MRQRDSREKRAVPRLERNILVQYTIKEMPLSKGFQISKKPYVDISRTIDLSEKGILFTASSELVPQVILDIQLKVPIQRKQVELKGKVVTCEQVKEGLIYKIGVEFVGPNEEQRRLLREFVNLFLTG